MTNTMYCKPTIYNIKGRVKNAPHFFDAKTLKFFGQTMRSFKVSRIDDRLFMLSAPMLMQSDSGMRRYAGSTVRVFDAETDTFMNYPQA